MSSQQDREREGSPGGRSLLQPGGTDADDVPDPGTDLTDPGAPEHLGGDRVTGAGLAGENLAGSTEGLSGGRSPEGGSALGGLGGGGAQPGALGGGSGAPRGSTDKRSGNPG
jgi:hypothetical protein